MAHNFVKQNDGSKMCRDEIGVSIERDCPHPGVLFQQQLASAVREYHKVVVILPNSKLCKGIHAHVYELAATSAAFYNGEKEQSIFYEGNDLHVVILYETRSACALFVNNLFTFLRHFKLVGEMQFNPDFEILKLPDYPRSVFLRDYDPKESDLSSALTNITHISSLSYIELETELQMIENPNHDDFIGLGCYKCHLMSQSAFAREKDNPNNWLWMSWYTQQRFDGLNPIGRHRIPQIAIKFVSCSGSLELLQYGMLEREKVEIAIECPDAAIFGVMRNRVKPDNATFDEVSRTITTWVFVVDAADFQRCLTFKYQETQFYWSKHERGAVLNDVEAHELRRSGRAAAIEAMKEKLL